MDKMLTGTSKKKVPNKERITSLPRPNSDLDLNEMEEDQYYLDNLADEEVLCIGPPKSVFVIVM